MILASRTSGTGIPVTLIHGFTQTGASWTPVCEQLRGIHATTLDAPGHGGSADGARSLPTCGADIIETVGPGVLVGYSMGARMALHAALARPDHFTGVVLVSGTPGIEDEVERASRMASDNLLADRIEEIGVERFVEEWLANPMFAGLSPEMRMIPDRLRNSARGLADSLRHAGTGTQDNLWGELSRLTMPVLLVTGGNDTKFSAIAERMTVEIPRPTWVCIDGAGHTVHLENTRHFCRVLQDWISSEVPAGTPRST